MSACKPGRLEIRTMSQTAVLDAQPRGRPPVAATHRRLFFALWPDPAVVEQLVRWAHLAHDLCGGRAMRADTLHLTLAFLGSVETERIPALQELLAARRWPGGTLVLDHMGQFRGPRIVWAGSSTPVPWLETLHAALWRDLNRQGLTEPAEAFRPHVSLLRNAGAADLAALPAQPAITWRADRLVLVASLPRESGSYYEVISEYAL